MWAPPWQSKIKIPHLNLVASYSSVIYVTSQGVFVTMLSSANGNKFMLMRKCVKGSKWMSTRSGNWPKVYNNVLEIVKLGSLCLQEIYCSFDDVTRVVVTQSWRNTFHQITSHSDNKEGPYVTYIMGVFILEKPSIRYVMFS